MWKRASSSLSGPGGAHASRRSHAARRATCALPPAASATGLGLAPGASTPRGGSASCERKRPFSRIAAALGRRARRTHRAKRAAVPAACCRPSVAPSVARRPVPPTLPPAAPRRASCMRSKLRSTRPAQRSWIARGALARVHARARARGVCAARMQSVAAGRTAELRWLAWRSRVASRRVLRCAVEPEGCGGVRWWERAVGRRCGAMWCCRRCRWQVRADLRTDERRPCAPRGHGAVRTSRARLHSVLNKPVLPILRAARSPEAACVAGRADTRNKGVC